MKASTVSIRPTILRSALSVALAVGALTIFNVRAHAADLNPITVSAPVVKTVATTRQVHSCRTVVHAFVKP